MALANVTHREGVRIGAGAALTHDDVTDTTSALTDSSGGTASSTIAAIGATYDQAEVRNAVASLAAEVTALRSALVSAGLIG